MALKYHGMSNQIEKDCTTQVIQIGQFNACP
jgi:hypothetical protein